MLLVGAVPWLHTAALGRTVRSGRGKEARSDCMAAHGLFVSLLHSLKYSYTALPLRNRMMKLSSTSEFG